MPNTTVPVTTQRSATITAGSAATLDAAVKTQVNTLVQSYINPKNTGATPGTVYDGSIRISDSRISTGAESAPNWYATIFWNEALIPS